MNSLSEMEGTGRHLVIGIASTTLTAEEAEFITAHGIGGVILFGRNLDSLEQLIQLIQAIRNSSPQKKLIWIDQEGGRVQRIRAPLTRFPSAGSFARLAPSATARALAEAAGRVCGWELATLGIGVNCAPVLDIRETGADPVIGERAFGTTPDQVVELAESWLAGFNSTGVMAVGKHFPGHGAARVDSHLALPVIPKSRRELEEWELVPFSRLLPLLPALMTAHLVATGLDPEQPATFSAPTLSRLLRTEWDYPGVVVTDALEMRALEGSLEQRAEQAVVAGSDLVMCCTGRLEESRATLEGASRGLARLPASEVAARRQRIAALIDRYAIAPGDPAALFQNPEYRALRDRVEGVQDLAHHPDPTVQLLGG